MSMTPSNSAPFEDAITAIERACALDVLRELCAAHRDEVFHVPADPRWSFAPTHRLGIGGDTAHVPSAEFTEVIGITKHLVHVRTYSSASFEEEIAGFLQLETARRIYARLLSAGMTPF